MSKAKEEVEDTKEELVVTPKFENVKATPVPKVEGGKTGALKIDRKDIINDRYLKVEKRKCIVESLVPDVDEFTGITPPKVNIKGKDGEYFDLDNPQGTRYFKFRGKCGDEVELDQYMYNSLRGSSRVAQEKFKNDNGTYSTRVVRKRKWSIEVL